jgi:hypothetical protein
MPTGNLPMATIQTHRVTTQLRARRYAAIGATVLVALLAGACDGDELADPSLRDAIKPRITLARATTSADSLVGVSLNAQDNLGIKTIRVSLTGAVDAAFDTTFRSSIQNITLPLSFRVPLGAPVGSTIIARAVVFDGAGNQSDTARLVLTVGNLTPPNAFITSPVPGTAVVVGKSLILSVGGTARYKAKVVGYNVTGAFTFADSVIFTGTLRDSVAFLDTLTIPSTATGATITVTPFITDSLNQRVEGTAVSYTVQSITSVNSVPIVRTGVTSRIEVNDTIFVEASDPVGIVSIGYEVRSLAGALIAADSVSSDGSFTTLVRTFNIRLPISVFPTSVTVAGFARNSNDRRDVARHAGGAMRLDTVQVVAGSTNGLPFGGQVADAIYFPRNDRLYLTNIERNQVEVFNLADSSFKAPIIVGSRPWGIAAWPRNRDGTMADTLLVANSGGTNISYVDLLRGSTGQEVYRYPLPNIILYRVTTVRSQETDQLIRQRTVYDFSDRPQFLATSCKGPVSGSAPCGDVVLTYSTTPTPGQSGPFENRGTVRWENLTRRMSHFFYEHAIGSIDGRSDTLEIERYAAGGVGSDSVLVPFQQMVGGSPYSIVARLDRIPFRDTTFVRNSGNFRRVVIGEGGPVMGSRALTYDVTTGFDMTPPLPIVDRGISRPIDVSDFVANAYARVQGVGINFDGELAAVKGDSTYIFDNTLRLQGILQSRPSIGGIDFHPLNAGVNTGALNTRLAFVASAESVIDVFDTYCFRLIASVPIRDPIVGPIRASVRPNGQIVLVGATIRGVTLVALPDTFTTTCL